MEQGSNNGKINIKESSIDINENIKEFKVEGNENELSEEKKSKKNTISCYQKFLKNPSITKFNENSQFIYDLDVGIKYINTIQNPNYIKLNIGELDILKTKFLSIIEEKNEALKISKIFLDKQTIDDINKFFELELKDDLLSSFLKEQYEKNKNRNGFTSRKLAEKYYLETGIKVSHTTINYTLKNKLGLKYKKVIPKTSKIFSKENKIHTMALLKIIARCLKQNISIIYVDETHILNINNNLKAWIKKSETLYCEIEPRKKSNLIMGINENGVVYYEIHTHNINEEIYLKFIENLKFKLASMDIKNYALFLDNCSFHKSKKAIKYYYENKVNIIFNTPYLSIFNSIELAFRGVKNILYRRVYNNMNEVEKDLHLILNSEKFQKTIKYNLKETIGEYLNFYEKYKSIDFKSYKI